MTEVATTIGSRTPVERFDEELGERLVALDERGLLREMVVGEGIDFTSNDYLGLAASPRLRQAAARAYDEHFAGSGTIASPASRLLRGTTQLHLDLERRFAAWKGDEAALLSPSGYQANLGLLGALVGRQDRVLSDELNHASLIDGIRLAGPSKKIVPHLDLEAYAEHLAEPWPQGHTFVVTESLFSMDGDIAPLDRLAELCDRSGAHLLVDDAHATGLFGASRSGLVEHFSIGSSVVATVSTCGKSIAASGAFVSGSKTLIRYLFNRARPFIFTTAPSPLLLVGLGEALSELQREPERAPRVLALAARLRRRLSTAGLRTGGEGPIVPVVVGGNELALELARRVQLRGFDVRAVRPPTVPEGTARLRISVHADHDDSIVDDLASAVVDAAGELGLR